jgi:hypothetical protein
MKKPALISMITFLALVPTTALARRAERGLGAKAQLSCADKVQEARQYFGQGWQRREDLHRR